MIPSGMDLGLNWSLGCGWCSQRVYLLSQAPREYWGVTSWGCCEPTSYSCWADRQALSLQNSQEGGQMAWMSLCRWGPRKLYPFVDHTVLSSALYKWFHTFPFLITMKKMALYVDHWFFFQWNHQSVLITTQSEIRIQYDPNQYPNQSIWKPEKKDLNSIWSKNINKRYGF